METQAIEIREEFAMIFANMLGHSFLKLEWANYAWDMYKEQIKRKDPALFQMLIAVRNHENHISTSLGRYVEFDEETMRIFVKHLGGFFETLRRANPEQKGYFFAKLDDLQQEFSEAVNGKEGRVI